MDRGEVEDVEAELAAAQTDPNVFPTPDTSVSPAGPKWIQIGTEGGFLPAPVVVPNQPITQGGPATRPRSSRCARKLVSHSHLRL